MRSIWTWEAFSHLTQTVPSSVKPLLSDSSAVLTPAFMRSSRELGDPQVPPLAGFVYSWCRGGSQGWLCVRARRGF